MWSMMRKLDGGVGGFELEAELGFEGFVEGCVMLSGDDLDRGGVVDPVKGEVVEAGEAGLVDNGTRDGGECRSWWGARWRGERAEWRDRRSAVRVGGGWDVGDDAAEGRKVADGRRGVLGDAELRRAGGVDVAQVSDGGVGLEVGAGGRRGGRG